MCNDPCASGTVESPNTFQRAGNLRNCTFLRGIRTPILGPPKYTCNRHLNRFIHFCTAHDRDQQTDKTQPQTTLQQDMCSNRPHLKRQIVLRCCLKRVCPGQVFTGVGVVWNSLNENTLSCTNRHVGAATAEKLEVARPTGPIGWLCLRMDGTLDKQNSIATKLPAICADWRYENEY